jgi:hypothetical protein
MGKGSNRRPGNDEEYRKTWERVFAQKIVKKPKELEQLSFLTEDNKAPVFQIGRIALP